MLLDDCTVLTCTYNKCELVDYMVRSLFKQLGRKLPVVVMNNGGSVHSPVFNAKLFREVDNRGSKLLGMKPENMSQPSDRHACSIDWALHHAIDSKWVLLADDDVLFKPPVRKLLATIPSGSDYGAVGQVGWDRTPGDRLLPYFCAFNAYRMRRDGIRYWRPDMCMASKPPVDTGASFNHDISAAGWRILKIELVDFVDHLKNASLRNLDTSKWIDKGRSLWE